MTRSIALGVTLLHLLHYCSIQGHQSQDSPPEPPEEHESGGQDGSTGGSGCRSGGEESHFSYLNCSGEMVERKGERDDAGRVQVK